MNLRVLLLATCTALSAQPMPAQTRTAGTDPLSGKWAGTMGQDETRQVELNIEMKFDGKALTGTVTGPNLTPGDIMSGTFDPATGALKFLVVVRDGTNVNFDGNLAQGTVSGRVIFPGQTGVFKISKQETGQTTAAQPARAAASQPARVDPAMAAAQRSFTEASGWVTRAADLVPSERYAYRPAQTVRTFGQVIGHIADAYTYYCGRAAGRSVEWSDATEKGVTTKAALTAKLKQALDGCVAVYGGTGQIAPLIENVGHTSLHYGNLVTYIRMMGLVPPSS